MKNNLDNIHLLLKQGRIFAAYEQAKKGLDIDPVNTHLRELAAICLLKTGAVDEAKILIQPLLDSIETMMNKGDFATISQDVVLFAATVFNESCRFYHTFSDFEKAYQLYAYHFNQTNDIESGANAAVFAWILANDEACNHLCTHIIQSTQTPKEHFFTKDLSALAIAHVLMGEFNVANSLFGQITSLCQEDYTPIVTLLHQLKILIDNGFALKKEYLENLKPPAIVVFTGQMIDFPEDTTKRFPAYLEKNVFEKIKTKLDQINAKIGYSSASCGSDILFIEAMLARGGEINIILPFAKEDFIQNNVEHAGPRWIARFEKCLKAAKTVSYATNEKYLGHEMLYRFANMVLHGIAEMRGHFLLSPPHLLAVWDAMPGSLIGGASDFIDHWSDIRTLHLIELNEDISQENDHFREQNSLFSLYPRQQKQWLEKTPRIIKTILFADLCGFSRLQEEHIPGFLDFLEQLRISLSHVAVIPKMINTWGDAFFIVMDNASELALYALHLSKLVPEISNHIKHMPLLNIRISLHAGPVYERIDPFRQTVNYYGGHINRDARLEPVTVIGQVYATEQFMALVTAEQSIKRVEAMQKGKPFVESFACEYVGIVSLAKNFGEQPVYHLRHL